MVPNLNRNTPRDIIRDFEPVSLVATVEWGWVASPQSTYKNAGELIAAARLAPGKIDYASGGSGSPQHAAMALFAAQTGVTRRMCRTRAQLRPPPTWRQGRCRWRFRD